MCQYEGCGQAFGRKGTLKKHISGVHLNVRKHVCSYKGCGKAFTEKGNLKTHVMGVHLKTRPKYPRKAAGRGDYESDGGDDDGVGDVGDV